ELVGKLHARHSPLGAGYGVAIHLPVDRTAHADCIVPTDCLTEDNGRSDRLGFGAIFRFKAATVQVRQAAGLDHSAASHALDADEFANVLAITDGLLDRHAILQVCDHGVGCDVSRWV